MSVNYQRTTPSGTPHSTPNGSPERHNQFGPGYAGYSANDRGSRDRGGANAARVEAASGRRPQGRTHPG